MNSTTSTLRSSVNMVPRVVYLACIYYISHSLAHDQSPCIWSTIN